MFCAKCMRAEPRPLVLRYCSHSAPCVKASRSFWPEGPGLRSVERSMAARLRAGDSGTGRSPPVKLLVLLVADTLAGSSCSREHQNQMNPRCQWVKLRRCYAVLPCP